VSRVVVIGAGMGGLAVAARLARQRHSVVVCEQSGTYGGKVGTYERDGFVFDTGPSLLTLPAVYRDLFLKTGSALEDNVELIPVEPAFRYRFADDTTLDVPNASRARIAAAFEGSLGPGTGTQWTSFIDHAADVWKVTRTPFLENPLGGPKDLLRQSLRLRDLRLVAPWRSLRAEGRKHLQDPRLRMVLDRYATYTGSDPRRAPAALSVVPYIEQTFGAWHVAGGLRRLVDATYSRCLEKGVKFRFSADVGGVVVEGGRVTGVRLVDGEQLSADVVVADADATHLYRDLVHDPRAQGEKQRLSRTAPSLSAFVLLLALSGRTSQMRHHTVLFPESYDAEFDSIFGGRPQPVDDPAIYICNPVDPAMRPEAGEAWFVLVNAPRHAPASGVDWCAAGIAESYADRVLDVLASRGLDVRDRLLWRVVRTPADLERETRSPGGSIYGSSSNGPRAAFLRPANRSPIPGLFLVGGSAHPGGGLPLVGLSAEIVANLIGRA
jgi:phytoene desaturase